MTIQGPGARVLVVDDERSIRRALQTILARRGYRVEVAETGEEALESYSRQLPDLIILDLGLPDIDGVDVIRQVRARTNTPIIVLSARGAERDKVTALDLGADDYLTKPFGVDELLARVRVALRHFAVSSGGGTDAIFRTGDLMVDLEKRSVSLAGQEVRLTPTEYNLLKALISHPNKVLTERMLLREVWGPEYGDEGHYVHVYIARLRKKIEPNPQSPRYLRTEPGVGYRLLAE